MKITSIETQMEYRPENLDKLNSLGEHINHNAKLLTGGKLQKLVGDSNYLIIGSSGVKFFDEETFKNSPNLKLISTLSAGTDYIDLRAAKKYGVTVCNARGANAQSVAEHIFGVTLSLSKRIQESHIGLRENNSNFEPFEGFELSKKTIGIVGFGEIGSKVAKIASGFDMKVVYYKRNRIETNLASYVPLDELFRISDVIVVAVPGNDSTRGMIGAELLQKMKEKSILVSISRESVIDEEAVLEVLRSGQTFGYGFDADINESPNSEFYQFRNVVITPHTAFFTEESETNVENIAVENIIKFHEGKPQNVVN